MMFMMRFTLKADVNAIEHLAWSPAYCKRSMSATTIVANTTIAIFKGYL